MSKTESRFKSKLESLKKLQHSASNSSAVEKARAFFRSLERKHTGSDRCSASRRRAVPSSISSSSSSSVIDDTPTYSTQDSSYPHSNGGIATARIIRVINPKDMIVHRVVHNDDRPYPLRTSSYYNGQVRYAPIQPPKSGNNERSHSYSVSIEKHVHVGRRPLSPQRVYSSSTDHRSSLPNSDLSHPLMSASMYNYRPLICRQMNSPSLMSSSFHEQSNRVEPPMSSWSQSVRRLNTEYASTIHALQQAKESLEQIHPQPMDSISKYANLVAKGINDLSNGEQKRSMGVTFCLTASMAKAPTLLPTTPTIFSKPKVIRPVELETFTPSIPASIPKLEPVIVAKEKTEPIANIIKKFNNLNHSTSNGKPSLTKTYELEEIPYDSPPPLALSSSDSSSSISEDSTRSTTSTSDENLVHPPDHTGQQEETTYTVETFYTNDVQSTARLLPLPQVVVIRENTTEEQFNLAQEKEEASKEVPTLNTPLLTYLNLAMKQTKTNEEEEEEKSDHSAIRDDVVTLNPHTQSPSLSPRLISSSSSSSTNSSTSTVLLKSNVNTPPPPSPIESKTSSLVQAKTSQLPKRTAIKNVSRLKAPSTAPTKIPSSTSQVKTPSLIGTKSIKPMLTNNTATTLRKPIAITNQSSTMTNSSIVNKTTPQQSSSTLTTAKKLHFINGGTNMTEPSSSNNPDSSSVSVAKNRVRSMVNQLNAASHSDRRIPTRLVTPESISKPTVNRPVLQRAMTINHETSPTMNNNDNHHQQQQHSVPPAYRRKAPLVRSTSNVKEGLLRWCQAQVVGYPNVSVTNLSSSWSDGLAFCALVHHFFPDAFDFHRLSASNRQENFELAFHVAEARADVPRLLDVSDMLIMGNTPDYKCIFTYLNSFLAKVKDIHPKSNGH